MTAPGNGHDDADPVEVYYSSSRNVTFHGKDEIGVTWGEWREMSDGEKNETISEWVNDLVDVGVVDDES